MIAPFEAHHGFEISNLDEVPHRIRVTLSTDRSPIDYTIDPLSPLVIPGYASPSQLPDFTMTLENPDSSGDAGIWVQEKYAFDLVGLGGPDTRPAFTCELKRAPESQDDGFWFSSLGRGPNPFSDRSRIAFQLAKAASVGVAIYDLQGRMVREFAEQRWPAGRCALEWDGLSDQGTRLGSGVYFYRVSLDKKPAGNGRLVLAR